jgi:ferredoxin-NADP reductase
MTWRTATVVEITRETARAKTFRCALPQPSGHRAGQHYVVRLTAPDGYTASRSYSIASAPAASNEFEITVERLDDGEVSTFLHDEVVVGDELEVRGPIGGWFVWDGESPALLVGGGSGVVPLMAMLRLARKTGRNDLVRLVVSVRTPDNLYYANEIVGPETTLVYTRKTPPGFMRPPAHLAAADVAQPITPDTRAYICGSTAFADAASDVVMGLGVPAERIRIERFGPTG